MSVFTMTYPQALKAEPGIEAIALTQYPIFDEGYREYLNRTIADHFHNREIGMETASMFELALRRKMNLIMPFYNQHYITSLKAAGVDPLQTMSITSKGKNSDTSTGKNTGTTTGDSDTTGDSNTVDDASTVADSTSTSAADAVSRAVGSEFPQALLSDRGDYATSAQDNTSKTVSEGSGRETSNTAQTSNSIQNSKTRQTANTEAVQEDERVGESENIVTGSQGQTSTLLFQHRQTLVNVDLMVLNELEELFMSVWSTGDEFTPRMSGMGSFGYFGYTGIW